MKNYGLDTISTSKTNGKVQLKLEPDKFMLKINLVFYIFHDQSYHFSTFKNCFQQIPFH